MYVKWIGAGIICASTTLLGVQAVAGMRLRVQMLTALLKTLKLLRGEIQYAATGLAELFMGMQKTAGTPFGGWFYKLGERLLQQSGETMQEIWKTEIESGLAGILPKEDRVWLEGLGELLGMQDRAMQLGVLDLYMEQLAGRLEEARRKIAEKSKMYHCVGALSGILLVLLLF